MEYKYRLDKGAVLLYSWKATGRVNYELHAEPDGAPKGYAESYEKRNAQESASGAKTSGSLRAISDTEPLHTLHRRASRSARRAFVQSIRSASAG